LRASTPEQQAFIGNQAGGRVFLFLAADDFENIVRDVRSEPFRLRRRRSVESASPSFGGRLASRNKRFRWSDRQLRSE
jgi:hypothetical protein